MDRNSNLIISAAVFVLGAIFILSDSASINADVVGFSGGNIALASTIGLFMIILSGLYFVAHLQGAGAKGADLERMARLTESKHEEITKEEIVNQDLAKKYGQPARYDDKKAKPEEKHPGP